MREERSQKSGARSQNEKEEVPSSDAAGTLEGRPLGPLPQAPLVRVNAIAPATAVEGSAMFPREQVIASLRKYQIAFREDESTEELRRKLAGFYAQRTLTRQPISPRDCGEAICWLASDRAAKTTGHLIPVDGGLTEAFLQ